MRRAMGGHTAGPAGAAQANRDPILTALGPILQLSSVCPACVWSDATSTQPPYTQTGRHTHRPWLTTVRRTPRPACATFRWPTEYARPIALPTGQCARSTRQLGRPGTLLCQQCMAAAPRPCHMRRASRSHSAPITYRGVQQHRMQPRLCKGTSFQAAACSTHRGEPAHRLQRALPRPASAAAAVCVPSWDLCLNGGCSKAWTALGQL